MAYLILSINTYDLNPDVVNSYERHTWTHGNSGAKINREENNGQDPAPTCCDVRSIGCGSFGR